MEMTNEANDFVGSPFFISVMLIGIIAIGFILRMTFRSSNSEYKHRPEK